MQQQRIFDMVQIAKTRSNERSEQIDVFSFDLAQIKRHSVNHGVQTETLSNRIHRQT
jgi:hypothetical protein